MVGPRLYWPLVEPYWDEVRFELGWKRLEPVLQNMPPASRHLLSGHWCISEVANGGLHQFFWNGTGVLAPEALEAFRELGMPQLAGVLQEAMALFGTPFPRKRNERHQALHAFEAQNPDAWDPFNQLDVKFWELMKEEAGGWEAAANAYARRASWN